MLLALICGTVLVLAALLMALGILKIPSLRTIHLLNQLPGPKCFPIIGYLLTQVAFHDKSGILKLVELELEKYGGFYTTWSFGSPSCMVADADILKAILNNMKYTKKTSPYHTLKSWLGEGLVTSGGEKWKHQRKILTPCFHNHFGEHSLGIINRQSEVLAAQMLERCGAPEDIWPLIRRFSLKVMVESGMGIVLDDDNPEVRLYGTLTAASTGATLTRAVNPLLNREFIYKLTPAGRKYHKSLEFLHGFTEKIIKQRRADSEKKRSSPEEENDDSAGYVEPRKRHVAFLDKLLALGMTDREIREQVDTFTLAGQDTSSAAILFTIFELGHHPDVQDKVYEEQMEIIGKEDRPIMDYDLSKMDYLTAVIKETLRIYPSAPMIARCLEQDIVLPGGQIIPATTNVSASIFHMQRNPKYFRDPLKFVPERFMNINSEWSAADRHPFSYIPFSAGPRNCIGQKFAMVELKAALSTLVRKLKFSSVTPRTEIYPALDFVFRSATPVLIRCSARE